MTPGQISKLSAKQLRKAMYPNGIIDELWNFVEWVAERGEEGGSERELVELFTGSAKRLLKRRRKKS